MKREEFQYNIEFFDANENVVSYYHSDLIQIPDEIEDFSLHIKIPKHALPKGRYFVKMEAVITDHLTCLPFDSCFNTLSFEVTQVSKQGPIFYQDWFPGYGLTVHNQDEFEIKANF